MLLEFIRGQATVFEFLIFVISAIVAITIHEFAHAVRAVQAGDSLPREQGRLTLNPIAHYDPIGTTMILALGMGWGRPVMTQPSRFKNPRRDSLMVSLWGPLSNICLGVFVLLLMRFLPFLREASNPWSFLCYSLVQWNLFLAFFNLIPLPPLDGSKVLSNLLPTRQAIQYDKFAMQFGMLVLMLLVFSGSGFISYWVNIPTEFLIKLIFTSFPLA